MYTVLSIIAVGFFSYLIVFPLSPRSINYISEYKKATICYMLANCAAVVIFFPLLVPYIYPFQLFPVLLLILWYVLLFAFYRYFQKKQLLDLDMITQYQKKGWYFPAMANRYIITKTGNILLQQILGISVVSLLLHNGLSRTQVLITISVLGIITHVYLLKRGIKIALYFIFAAAVAGIVFPYILMTVLYGFIYTFILHWLFYLISAIAIHMHNTRHRIHR